MNRIEHREEKWVFPFVEYTCDIKDEKLPLIIQLHGAGERGCGKDDLDLVDVHGLTEHLTDGDYKCKVVMPQCPKDSFWAARVESIIRFIEQLKTEFNVDESRIYLTGFSMGAYGTWYTAMARPDLFAAIAPVSGGGMAWNAGVLDMPVWAFHGAEDKTVSVNQSDEMVEALKRLNKDVKYTRFENEGHIIGKLSFTPELIEWLLSQK